MDSGTLPVAGKTYVFRVPYYGFYLYTYIYIKFLRKVGLFGYRQGLLVGFGSGCGGVLRAGKTLFGIGCLIRPGFRAQKRNFSERLPSSQRWITQLKNRGLLCPSSQWLGNPFYALHHTRVLQQRVLHYGMWELGGSLGFG